MNKVKELLKILSLGLISLCLLAALAVSWSARGRVGRILANLEATSEQSREASASATRVLALYEAELSSERNKKALAASLAAAASWQATARLVNTQLIPEATEAIASVSSTNRELQSLLRRQNSELALTQEQARSALSAFREQTELIGPEISRLAATTSATSEQTGHTVAEFQRSAEEMTKILANLEQASASAPAIAKSLEQIAGSGQRWQRPISFATLLIALLGAIK